MTQTANSQTFRKLMFQRLLFVQGLGWLGGLGVFSSSLVLAQAPAPAPSHAIAIPEPAAVPSAAGPATAAVPSTQADPAVAVPLPLQATPAAPESFPLESAPPAAVTPLESSSSVPAAILTRPKSAPPADTYEAPSEIVLSERSTGCRSVVPAGQRVSYGPCGAPRPPVTSAPRDLPGRLAAQVAPIAFNSAGGFSVVGTTPSVRDYYQRTLRPPGRLGNGNIQLIFPLSIPAVISSAFGWRTHPISGEQRFHSGTDLAAPMGTPVLAAYAGRVVIADFLGGYGLAITLEHNKGTQQTLYGHLSEIFVKPGEWVQQGTAIGRVGSTGYSTGPHLHFEFRQLTADGWVALDAGTQLEYAMAQLVKALQTAQAKPVPKG